MQVSERERGKNDTQVKMLWLCGPLASNLKNNLFKRTMCSALIQYFQLHEFHDYLFLITWFMYLVTLMINLSQLRNNEDLHQMILNIKNRFFDWNLKIESRNEWYTLYFTLLKEGDGGFAQLEQLIVLRNKSIS